jgi:hypothetical protein
LIPVYAYTDESGNTGNSIFDGAQPFFWTGTLLSKNDLEAQGNPAVQNWARMLNVDELHAAELGLHGIEIIADRLRYFISKQNCLFVFTRIEKRHVASTKLVDTLIDSGINAAVSNLHYGVKFLRLYLAHVITELLEPRNQEEFWSVYENGDAGRFCKILGDLHWSVKHYIEDQRTRELLLDAIQWGLDHPEPLLEATRTDLDAPNMVAFSLLLGGIHEMFKATPLKVVRFIHDAQNQFAKAIVEMYQVLKRMASSSNGPFAWMADLTEMDTYKCPVEVASSESTAGLQIVDVILWLTKRRIEGPWKPLRACDRLISEVARRSEISEFSRAQLREDIVSAMAQVNSMDVSKEAEAKAKKIIREIEEARKTRMLAGY